MFRCDQNGPPARRSEPNWRKEGAYLNGYVTDEQRSRRPSFIATLWAVASWLFFRVARSLRIDSRYARRNRQSGSDRLEKQPTDLRRNSRDLGDGTLACRLHSHVTREWLWAEVPHDCFKLKERALSIEATAISHQTAIRSDHTMAWDNNCYGILS